MKTCSKKDKCLHPNGPLLDLSQFGKDKHSKDGYTSNCRECRNARNREYRQDPIAQEYERKRYREYRQRTEVLERRKEQWTQYKAKNNDRIREKYKEWYWKNREYKMAYAEEYRQRDEVVRHRKKYYQEYRSRPETKKRKREYEKQRLKIDDNYRLKKYLRSRVYTVLKKSESTKDLPTMKLIGCTAEELWLHFEKYFSNGNMTRDNYGKVWVHHHIVPCDMFDLTKKSEQKKCFNYKNLMPVLKGEHISLHAKMRKEKKKLCDKPTEGN